MVGKVLGSGQYELLESERGRLMLLLNRSFAFTWHTENNIHKLLYTRGVSAKSGDKNFRLLRSGSFYLLNRQDNTKFSGMPHLYLRHETHFDEYILTDGLPDISIEDKEIFPTHRVIPVEELENFALQKY
jgi:hypothetical protein